MLCQESRIGQLLPVSKNKALLRKFGARGLILAAGLAAYFIMLPQDRFESASVRASNGSLAARDISNSSVNIVNGLSVEECRKLIDYAANKLQPDRAAQAVMDEQISQIASQL